MLVEQEKMDTWGSFPMSDIDRTFQEVYRSLVQDDVPSEQIYWKNRKNRRISRSATCLTLQRSSMTTTKITEEKLTMSMLSSTSVIENHGSVKAASPERGNSTYPGCKAFMNEQRKRVKTQSVTVNTDQAEHELPIRQDLVDEENTDNLHTSFSDGEPFSLQYNTVETDVCSDVSLETECPDKQIVCAACQKLQLKVRKYKTSGIKKPKIFDPNHWCSDFWMFLNRVPVKSTFPRLKRSLSSSLKTLERRLFSGTKGTAGIGGRCSRAHTFLHRNLRLCKEAREKSFNQRQKRIKRKKSGPSRKLKPQVNKKAVTSTQDKDKAKGRFVFLLDSSEDEETDVKRKILHISKGDCDLPLHTSPELVSKVKKKSTPVRQKRAKDSTELPLSSTTSFHVGRLLEASDISSSLEVEDSDTEQSQTGTLPTESPDTFPWVRRGSFRDMLARLNSGCLNSVAVKEH